MEVPNATTNKSKALHWCLTINNWLPTHEAQFAAIQDRAAYYVYGKEVGAEGTPHLQAYVCFKNRISFPAIKKLFPTAHIEVKAKRSTPAQAADYCKKDGVFIEFGELPAAQNVAGGEANGEKWEEVRQLCYEDRIEEIDAKIYVQHYNTLKRIRSDKRNQRVPKDLDWADNNAPNEWIWGPTGTGLLLLLSYY